MDYSTTPDSRYKCIDDVVTNVEAVAREIAVDLVQKVINVLKTKEAVEKTQVEEVKVETKPLEEVPKDDQQS
jgi:hypothetical protein